MIFEFKDYLETVSKPKNLYRKSTHNPRTLSFKEGLKLYYTF